jgi:hypothetical protein
MASSSSLTRLPLYLTFYVKHGDAGDMHVCVSGSLEEGWVLQHPTLEEGDWRGDTRTQEGKWITSGCIETAEDQVKYTPGIGATEVKTTVLRHNGKDKGTKIPLTATWKVTTSIAKFASVIVHCRRESDVSYMRQGMGLKISGEVLFTPTEWKLLGFGKPDGELEAKIPSIDSLYPIAGLMDFIPVDGQMNIDGGDNNDAVISFDAIDDANNKMVHIHLASGQGDGKMKAREDAARTVLLRFTATAKHFAAKNVKEGEKKE